MSLNIALFNAISGLQSSQRAIDVTAQNVANVNTVGYSRKVVHQQARTLAGQGAGVEISEIARVVNEALLKELQITGGTMSASKVTADYFNQLQNLFGSPESESSLSAALTDLAAKFQALSVTPEDVSARIEVTAAARILAQKLRDTSTKIESLRTQADQEIGNVIVDLNTQLETIHDLNLRIAEAKATGFETPDLEDQRDRALAKVGEYIDITYFKRSNGEIVVMTTSGRTLVDRSAEQLTHTPIAASDPLLTWAEGGIAGITLGGADITGELRSGKLSSLVAMRDTTLPNLHAQIEELATTLHDEVNALHNQGTGYPGAASLTTTRTFAAGDTPVWSGLFRVAAVDQSGVVVETQDFDLATYATVGALVTAINGMANVNASIGADGKITVSATAGKYVATNEMTSAVTVGSRTLGASNFLGLNDFFSSSNDYDTYTSAQASSKTTPLGIAGTLTFRGAFGTTNVNYLVGNTLEDVANAITANATLAAQGISASVVTDGDGYRLRIADAAGNYFITDSGTLLSNLKVQARGANVSGDINVRSDILSNPTLVSRATLASGVLAVGGQGVSAGDNSAVQAIANKFNEALSYSAVGGLAAGPRTFADYSSAVLGMNATQAANAQDALQSSQFLYSDIKAKAESVSGVNLDEEMANLVVLQNAYAAAARVISTTSELFDVLVNIGR
ncbi:MAG TPA: flagellar hook-associated protein FlgK [Alphaproteobacteria bacterium]